MILSIPLEYLIIHLCFQHRDPVYSWLGVCVRQAYFIWLMFR